MHANCVLISLTTSQNTCTNRAVKAHYDGGSDAWQNVTIT